MRAELDYLTEGRNAERFAANFAGDSEVQIPRVFLGDNDTVLSLGRME